MDPSDRPPVTPDCDASDHAAAANGDIDCPEWPLGHPTREALDYLEQALTTGIPKPTYDGPIRRLVMHDGWWPVDLVFALPLETPLHDAQSTSLQHFMWSYVDSNPVPDVPTCSPDELTKIPANNTRDAQFRDPQSPNDLAKTTNTQSLPRDTFSRPKLGGAPRMGSSSRTQGDSTEPAALGKAAAKAPRRANPSGRRRTVKFQLPQNEADTGPSETAQARPRFMVTIKSHAAAWKWQELEQKKKWVANIQS